MTFLVTLIDVLRNGFQGCLMGSSNTKMFF